MADFIETVDSTELFAIPVYSVIVFPMLTASIELDGDVDVDKVEAVHAAGELAVLLTKNKNTAGKTVKDSDVYHTATAVFISQIVRLPDGKTRAMVIGADRVKFLGYSKTHKGYARVMMKRIYSETGSYKTTAALAEADRLLDEYLRYAPKDAHQIRNELSEIKEVGQYSDHLAAALFSDAEDKLKILEVFDPQERILALLTLLREKIEIVTLQQKIRREVDRRVDKNQRDYYLNEQLKVIHGELGEDSDTESEYQNYCDRIEDAKLSEENREKLTKEANKLRKIPFNSMEYGVICNYLDVCLDIPWNKYSRDRTDIKAAMAVLNRDHDGLEKVKERIVEYLAVKQLSPSLGNQIICLVGPPGTGKTSIARSIAEAMHRKYVRVSLGGVRDEADIRGHRKTYVGAMPGRIVDALIKAGTSNPLMLLDEIDKMTRDSHGDPASAMMEVLDAEQNVSFRDHFVEMDIDLSKVAFIATANSLDTIPRPLLDRMEVIELKSYSMQEKMSIAKRHLIPKQLTKHGLSKKQLKISDAALKEIINGYTHEAGVRTLERKIAAICRKAAQMLLEGMDAVEVGIKNINRFLGAEKIIPEKISNEDEIGVVNGLAYTELGGSMLKVEVASMPGTGKMEFTGSLGNVMQESAKTAVSYIRSHADELSIDGNFYKDKDIHFHFPEGAVPKDGPSAGVTMVCALVSELTGKPVRRNVAMTGEVTLRGKVLAIGGLKEKTMAAYKAGVDTILIPEDNRKDLDDIDAKIRETVKFIPCKQVGDVLRNAIAY